MQRIQDISRVLQGFGSVASAGARAHTSRLCGNGSSSSIVEAAVSLLNKVTNSPSSHSPSSPSSPSSHQWSHFDEASHSHSESAHPIIVDTTLHHNPSPSHNPVHQQRSYHTFSSSSSSRSFYAGRRKFSTASSAQPEQVQAESQQQPSAARPSRREFVPRERSVPSSSVERLLHFGGLAARLAVGTVGEVVRRQVSPSDASSSSSSSSSSKLDSNSSMKTNISPDQPLYSPILTEANAEMIARTLCKMRGAALKLGQMISIQDESVIPPQVQKILEKVRNSADVMPRKQLEKVMASELGADWESHFVEFSQLPIAAASIGQVHSGILKDGRKVAVKVQYPGVAESIDSDLRNLRALLAVANFLPKGLYAEAAIGEVRKELLAECDYKREAACQRRFARLVGDDPDFKVPKIVDHLSSSRVLTTEFVNGSSIDDVSHADQETRNRVASRLLRLCLRELFEFRFMQTDPNWSNFFYDPETDKLALIDFGACREYPKRFVDDYLRVVHGSAEKDGKTVIEASRRLGFLTGDESEAMNDAHAKAAFIVGEPFASDQPYDFRNQSMTHRIHALVPTMVNERLTAPPPESYSLHRKLSGAFLLCFKLGAVIPCRGIFMDSYRHYKFGPEEETKPQQ